MQPESSIIVQEAEEALRLDKLLALRFVDYSRTYFQYLIAQNLVLLNGETAKKRVQVKAGDEVEVEFALTPELNLEAQAIPLEILYEDSDLLVINKPAGMVVHPAPGHPQHTFVNALLYHCRHLEKEMGNLRPGIVHRLDKDTSGLLIAAKNLAVQQKLVEQFAARKVKKEYIAICASTLKQQTVDLAIGRHPKQRQMMAVLAEGGKKAISHFYPLAIHESPKYPLSLVKVAIETGRTHQIRVHLKALQAPVLGDSLYGMEGMNCHYGVSRQLLHAYHLAFQHPVTLQRLELTAPLPQEMQQMISSYFPMLKESDLAP